MTAERLSTSVAPRAENALPCTPKSLARATTFFTPAERRLLFKQARPIMRHAALDIRGKQTHVMGRILIVAPRKIGSAPIRNLLKRRLRALFYEERLFELHRDIIVYLKPGCDQLTYGELVVIVKQAIMA